MAKTNQALCFAPEEDNQVRCIASLDEYTPTEIAALWFTNEEYKHIKGQVKKFLDYLETTAPAVQNPAPNLAPASHRTRINRRHSNGAGPPARPPPSSFVCPCAMRGLERKTRDGARRKQQLVHGSVLAVLDLQRLGGDVAAAYGRCAHAAQVAAQRQGAQDAVVAAVGCARCGLGAPEANPLAATDPEAIALACQRQQEELLSRHRQNHQRLVKQRRNSLTSLEKTPYQYNDNENDSIADHDSIMSPKDASARKGHHLAKRRTYRRGSIARRIGMR